MLKATFSKHWLVKLAWHVCTYSLKFKIWYNRNGCSYKWRLHRMITWKLLFDGEELKLLTAKDLNLWRGIFLMGKMSKFLVVGQDFSPLPGLLIKVQRKGEQPTPGGCNNFVTFLVRREMPGIWFWEIILLRDLAVIELFQISHNCVTECTLQAKFLLKLI